MTRASSSPIVQLAQILTICTEENQSKGAETVDSAEHRLNIGIYKSFVIAIQRLDTLYGARMDIR